MRQTLIPLAFLLLLAGSFSCNTKKEKSEPAAMNTDKWEKLDSSKANIDTARGPGFQDVDLPPLPVFKITRQNLETIDQMKPAINKLIMQPGFGNIKDVTTLKLYMYKAKNHKHYARDQKAEELPVDETIMSYYVPSKFIIGNVELNFNSLRNEFKHGNTWDQDLLYLRLRPVTRKQQEKEYLSFEVVAIYTEAGKNLMLTGDLKPSPPAPPNPED